MVIHSCDCCEKVTSEKRTKERLKIYLKNKKDKNEKGQLHCLCVKRGQERWSCLGIDHNVEEMHVHDDCEIRAHIILRHF